jgi:uncharacterized protein YndB with AHSA1/START domain
MVDPAGNKLPAEPGCYLEIVPDRKLVWTSALGPGFRPNNPISAQWFFTAVLIFEPHGNGGCRYTATAIHTTKEQAAAHDKMGFTQGWGKALDQLVEYVKSTPLS